MGLLGILGHGILIHSHLLSMLLDVADLISLDILVHCSHYLSAEYEVSMNIISAGLSFLDSNA